MSNLKYIGTGKPFASQEDIAEHNKQVKEIAEKEYYEKLGKQIGLKIESAMIPIEEKH